MRLEGDEHADATGGAKAGSERRPLVRPGVGVACVALALALVAAAYLLVADVYTTESCATNSAGSLTCMTTNETLAEANGNDVLLLLLIPVTSAAALVLLTLARGPRLLEWAVAVALFAACLIGGFGIGILFLPAAIAGIAAVSLDRRGAKQPPG